METYKAILTRRSIRKYKNRKVSDKLIAQLIKAGMYAPSAMDKQPWHFLVFRDEQMMESIIDLHQHAKMLKQASAGILICWDEKLQHDTGYGQVDCAAATQNILLAAHGLGLGACWIGIHPREKRREAVHKLFKLPKHVMPFAIISVGYPAIKVKQPERFKQSKIHYETW